jgi:PEP-CTERM motif
MRAAISLFAARLIGGVIIGAPLLMAPADAASVSSTLADATIDVVGITACTTVGCTNSNSQSATSGSGTADEFTSGPVDFVPPTGTALFDISTTSSCCGTTRALSEQGVAPLDLTVGGAGQATNVTAAGVPNPSLSISATATGSASSDGAFGLAQAVLTYSFEVVSTGHTSATSVDVTIDATGSVSATSTDPQSIDDTEMLYIPGLVNDQANVYYLATSNGVEDQSSTTGAGYLSALTDDDGLYSVTGGIDESGTYSVTLGQVYTVELTLYANCDANSMGAGSISCLASIDPFIIAPSGFEVLLSPGLGNAAVPEPSTWAMMLIGFCGLSYAAYRRQARRAVPIA